MFVSRLILFSSFLIFANGAFSLDGSISKESEKMVLKGKALLEYSIFKIDVYIASLYVGQSDNSKMLQLSYQRNIKKDVSIEGWKKGFSTLPEEYRVKNQDSINWIFENTIDNKKGDTFKIFQVNKKLYFIHNDKIIASTDNKVIAHLAFYPWLGEKPIDENFKQKLLGN